MSKKATSKKKATGRPRKYKTEEERLEAKRAQNRKYQRRYHKEKRKPRYQSDAKFREDILKRERQRYRENHPDYEPKGLGANHGQAASFAQVRLCRVGKSNRNIACLAIDDMAEFIGNSPKIMGEWIEAGKFPRPNHETVEGQRVFTVAQADAMAAILHRHLKNRATFRATDNKVIEELHGAFR